jgi:UDP-GlcNAc:undecaprenyl-phosphate/decaprenyl-phosphate GlcNAc-1-phosphate transferase
MEVHILSLNILLAIATSAIITAYGIPVVIDLALKKNLTDAPDNDRKIHKRIIPTLGGVAIFMGSIISFSLWVGNEVPVFFPFLVAGSVLLFVVGIRDDLGDMDPDKKFIAQALSASFVVIGGKVRLDFLDGFLGLNTLPEIAAILLTIFAFVVIINAYNLIDGVDGLAGTLSLIGTFFFGVWFAVNGHFGEAVLAASLAGALIGFLYYNSAPAKIFMGDTGSLVIGLIMGVMAFRLIELNAVSNVYSFETPTVFALSLLIIPVSDMLRVLIVRLLKRNPPFLPDRNHIHHKLLEMGFGHRNICRFLGFSFVLIIALSKIFPYRSEVHVYLFCILGLAALILPSAVILKRLQTSLKIRIRRRLAQKPVQYTMRKTEGNYIIKRETVLKDKVS